MDFTKQNNIFDRTTSLNNKLSKFTLTQADMKDINYLDELITKSILKRRDRTNTHGLQH